MIIVVLFDDLGFAKFVDPAFLNNWRYVSGILFCCLDSNDL